MKCIVMYVFEKHGNVGFGNSVHDFEHYPPTISDITKAASEYEKANGCKCSVLNWKELSEE